MRWRRVVFGRRSGRRGGQRRRGSGSNSSSTLGLVVWFGFVLWVVGDISWTAAIGLAVAAALIVWFLVRRARLSTPKAQDLYAQLQNVRAMSGGQFEVFVAQVLRAMGYRTTVLGGSGDQGVDIIAAGTDGNVAVQCKNYNRAVGNKPVQEVYAGARHHGCDHAWVVAPEGYTKGAYELAQSVGVALFDADSIREWIKKVDEAEKKAMEQSQPA